VFKYRHTHPSSSVQQNVQQGQSTSSQSMYTVGSVELKTVQTDSGMTPVRSFDCKNNSLSLVNWSNADGTLPENRLLFRRSPLSRLLMRPSSLGMRPLNWFLERSSTSRIIVSSPYSVGIEPCRALLAKVSVRRSCSWPISVCSVPPNKLSSIKRNTSLVSRPTSLGKSVNRLLERLKTRRFASKPISVAMPPEKKLSSSVSRDTLLHRLISDGSDPSSRLPAKFKLVRDVHSPISGDNVPLRLLLLRSICFKLTNPPYCEGIFPTRLLFDSRSSLRRVSSPYSEGRPPVKTRSGPPLISIDTSLFDSSAISGGIVPSALLKNSSKRQKLSPGPQGSGAREYQSHSSSSLSHNPFSDQLAPPALLKSVASE